MENISKYINSSTQTDLNREKENVRQFANSSTQTDFYVGLNSTPIKSMQEPLDFSELSTIDDQDDSEFVQFDDSTSSHEETHNLLKSKKYVVFESMIDKLLKFVSCPTCNHCVGKIEKVSMGTSLHCKIFCKSEHFICDWNSQPLIGKLPAFNLLLSAAIFFSGL